MNTAPTNPRIKVIYANTYRLDIEDDPTYPFIVVAHLRHPEFMSIAALFLYGPNEHVICLGMTVEDLLDWAYKSDNIPTHPRLLDITITDRQGNTIRSKKGRGEWTPTWEDISITERLRRRLLPAELSLE